MIADDDSLENEDKVNEPQPNYGAKKMRLRVFSSFEEAAEADYEFMRNLTPGERIAMLCELNLRAFGLPRPNQERRFYFDD